MPRLLDTDYINRHHFIRSLWRKYPQAFGVLSTRDQWKLHCYYQTQRDEPDEVLRVHRAELTTADPSLPHIASKAYHHLHACFTAADDYAGEDSLAFNRVIASMSKSEPEGGRRMSAVVRPEPYLDVLARALLRLGTKKSGKDSAA